MQGDSTAKVTDSGAGNDSLCCQRCLSGVGVAKLHWIENETGDHTGVAVVVCLCAYCMADAIERATGFKAVKTLDSWYSAREAAIIARQRTKAREQERENPLEGLD